MHAWQLTRAPRRTVTRRRSAQPTLAREQEEIQMAAAPTSRRIFLKQIAASSGADYLKALK